MDTVIAIIDLVFRLVIIALLLKIIWAIGI